MRGVRPQVQLGQVVKQVQRKEAVDPGREYRLLGARWYGEGLFAKETKTGQAIRANVLYKVRQGDFVYNRLFAWKGSFALVTEKDDGAYVSNEFPCFVTDPERLDPAFLWWFFRREKVWREALGLSSGATPTSRNRLKEVRFLGMSIALPPLDEQRRIVAGLQEVAKDIERARSLRSQSSEDVNAFVASLHNSLAGNRRRRLGQLLHLDEDRAEVVTEESYPQVGVRSFGGGLFAKAPIEGADTTYRSFNRLYEGALVLSQVKGWEGAVAVCPRSLAGWYASPEYRTFRCLPSEARPGYLSALVRTEWFWSRLGNATRGVGARRERTRPEQFLGLELPMPDVAKQEMAEAQFARVDVLRHLQGLAAGDLDAFLPAVLDATFG